MAWTKRQRQTAAIACRNAGIEDEHRLLILRQSKHAEHNGRVSSTSPRLTNSDFEQFMAIVENFVGGELRGFTRDYWRAKAQDELARMRRKVESLSQQLEVTGHLEPDSVGLTGWIRRMTGGEKHHLHDLDYRELYVVIEGLKKFAKRRGVRMEA